MNWEIDDTWLHEISTALRPIQPEGFEGRSFGGGGVDIMQWNAASGLFQSSVLSLCVGTAWRSSKYMTVKTQRDEHLCLGTVKLKPLK